METFYSLFGTKKDDVKHNCLVVPFLPPGLLETFQIKELTRGEVFASANSGNCTIIKTGMGAGFVGDAVLYLADTRCQNQFFLGSCGAITRDPRLDIGSIVMPRAAYSFESFSAIINKEISIPKPVYPSTRLYDKFSSTTPSRPYETSCVSFASLHQEEGFMPLFNSLNADVIEMECAAFFNAAHYTNKDALALLFVSDILGVTRFYEKLSVENKKKLTQGAKKAAEQIKRLIEN